MPKIIAALNMTIDGYCDHTVGIPDEQLHQHYTELLYTAGVVLYGRTTYQLMEYWRGVLEHPTGQKEMDDFAVAIDQVPKVVFSRALTEVDWASARLATQELAEELQELQLQLEKDIFICSPSLISQATQLGLIDEYQLCVHPVLAGSGLPLFKNSTDNKMLRLTNTKQFSSGVIILYYTS